MQGLCWSGVLGGVLQQMGAAAPQLRAVTLETLACLGQGHSSCAASTSLFAESRLEFRGSLGTDCFSEMLPLENGGKNIAEIKERCVQQQPWAGSSGG